MIQHEYDIITSDWKTDRDIDARVIRIPNTGAADTKVQLFHQLGRVPVCCRMLMTDKSCILYVVSKDAQKIVVQFTAANCDVNIEVY
jgi:hypothetical protein